MSLHQQARAAIRLLVWSREENGESTSIQFLSVGFMRGGELAPRLVPAFSVLSILPSVVCNLGVLEWRTVPIRVAQSFGQLRGRLIATTSPVLSYASHSKRVTGEPLLRKLYVGIVEANASWTNRTHPGAGGRSVRSLCCPGVKLKQCGRFVS